MTYSNLLTTDEKANLEDAAELQAYRNGKGPGQLAFDPPSPGRPIHVIYGYSSDEPTFHQQETAGGLPVWVCACCVRLTVGDNLVRCAGCLEPAGGALSEVLGESLACRSWEFDDRAGYDGPCLIAGSDGCDCPEAAW